MQRINPDAEILLDMLVETLMNKKDRSLPIRPDQKVLATQDWKITSSNKSCFKVPVRNTECRGNRCTEELSEIIKRITSGEITSDQSYTCKYCNSNKSLENLRIDSIALYITSRAKNALVESLVLGKNQRFVRFKQ